jgi:hypothetical protein
MQACSLGQFVSNFFHDIAGTKRFLRDTTWDVEVKDVSWQVSGTFCSFSQKSLAVPKTDLDSDSRFWVECGGLLRLREELDGQFFVFFKRSSDLRIHLFPSLQWEPGLHLHLRFHACSKCDSPITGVSESADVLTDKQGSVFIVRRDLPFDRSFTRREERSWL